MTQAHTTNSIVSQTPEVPNAGESDKQPLDQTQPPSEAQAYVPDTRMGQTHLWTSASRSDAFRYSDKRHTVSMIILGANAQNTVHACELFFAKHSTLSRQKLRRNVRHTTIVCFRLKPVWKELRSTTPIFPIQSKPSTFSSWWTVKKCYGTSKTGFGNHVRRSNWLQLSPSLSLSIINVADCVN